MSSTYRVLCLSHDPAIDTGIEAPRREPTEEAIRDGIDGHAGCDLMIGRYSYPLVELGCPPSAATRGHPGSTCCHSSTQWIDVDWIRLLAAVRQDPVGHASRNAASANFPCWTAKRLHRLRLELGTAHLYNPAAITES